MAEPTVAILLCTFNSVRFLNTQLASYAAQTYPHWSLQVNDDGSTDATRELLKAFAAAQGEHAVVVHEGPRIGFERNFLNLACRPDLHADYYAFSDHDDVWYADKLARAVAMLRTVPAARPAIYCSSSELIDEHGVHLGYSQNFAKRPSFANALVQSIGGGNTMVFNEAARQLLVAGGDAQLVPSHDWWLYQLVTGAGGVVHYDPRPTIAYRQHGCNVAGVNRGLRASLERIRYLITGRFKRWNQMNCEGLARVASLLTEENRACLAQFATARDARMIPRLRGLRKSGIYRQTPLGNLGITAAALLKRI